MPPKYSKSFILAGASKRKLKRTSDPPLSTAAPQDTEVEYIYTDDKSQKKQEHVAELPGSSSVPGESYPWYEYVHGVGLRKVNEKPVKSGEDAKDTVADGTHSHNLNSPTMPFSAGSTQANGAFSDSYRGSYAASAHDSVQSDAGQIELLRVRNAILEVCHDFPELRGKIGETAEESVVRLLENYRKLAQSSPGTLQSTNIGEKEDSNINFQKRQQEWQEKRNELESALVREKRKFKALESKHAQEKLTLVTTRDSLRRDLQKADKEYVKQVGKLKLQVDTLLDENQASSSKLLELPVHKKEIEKLNQIILHLQTEKAQIASKHDDEISSLRAAHKEQILGIQEDKDKQAATQQDALKANIAALKNRMVQEEARMQKQLKDIEAQNAAQLKNMDAAHTASLTKETSKWKLSMKKIEDKYQRHMEEYDMRVEDMTRHLRAQEAQLHEARKTQDQRRAEENERVEASLKTQEKALREQCEHEKLKLRAVIEDFKQAAATKNQPKGLTDAEVSVKFSKLANAVDDFSRIPWDPSKEAGWWQHQFEQLQARNTRRIKQQIVQNSVWMTLHEQIFCSPFKFFASDETWKTVDKDWVAIYSSGSSPSNWPNMTREQEEIRSDSAKRLRAMISSTITGQRMTDIQSRYESLVASTVEILAQKISKVAPLKEKDYKSLDVMIRLATDLWLECCSQRYRLLVTLVTGIEDILGLTQGHIRMVKLVLRPGLRRFGDGRGENLTKEETVNGWRNTFEIYPPQRGEFV